jgi:hypothetical protein
MDPASHFDQALMKKKKKVMAVGEGRTRVDTILEVVATEEGEHVLHDSGMSLKSFAVIVSFSAKQYSVIRLFSLLS